MSNRVQRLDVVTDDLEWYCEQPAQMPDAQLQRSRAATIATWFIDDALLRLPPDPARQTRR